VLPDLSVLWVIFFVLLLTVIMQQLFFKPVLRVMQAREDAVASARALADRSAAEALRASEEFDAKTTAARAVIYRDLDEMRRRSSDRRAVLLAETRAQAEADLARAREALVADVAVARKALDDDAESIGHTIADRLAGRRTH
jgi:F-type H+-transporting ATPase subunit b